MSTPPAAHADVIRDTAALVRARNNGDLEGVEVILAHCDLAEVCRELTGLAWRLAGGIAIATGIPAAQRREAVDRVLRELLGQAQDAAPG